MYKAAVRDINSATAFTLTVPNGPFWTRPGLILGSEAAELAAGDVDCIQNVTLGNVRTFGGFSFGHCAPV